MLLQATQRNMDITNPIIMITTPYPKDPTIAVEVVLVVEVSAEFVV